MKNNNEVITATKIKYDKVDLKTEFKKDVRKIIKLIKNRHRTSEYIKKTIKYRVLLLIQSYVIRNNKPFSSNQINFIVSMWIRVVNYSRSKTIQAIYITKYDILRIQENFVKKYRPNEGTKKENKQWNDFLEWEKDKGLD